MTNLKIMIEEKFRSIVHLFPPLYSMCLKTVSTYGRVYYKRLDQKYGYSKKLKTLKDSKTGQSCFIIGNGPSLRVDDLNKLADAHIDSFASNRIFKIFDKTKWRPTYFSVVDWKGIDDQDASKMQVPYMFFSDYYWRKHNVSNPNAIVFYGNRLSSPKIEAFKFSEDISQQIYMKGSVTYTNLQIAAYMGYVNIYLLGMDNSYVYVMGQDGKTVKVDGVEKSHFYEDEVTVHIYSEQEAMDNCFIAAKRYADAHGIKIQNATRGGKLEVFGRVDFDELLNS